MDINFARIIEIISQCRNLSKEKIIHLFYIYFLQIFKVYNITQLKKIVGLFFL